MVCSGHDDQGEPGRIPEGLPEVAILRKDVAIVVDPIEIVDRPNGVALAEAHPERYDHGAKEEDAQEDDGRQDKDPSGDGIFRRKRVASLLALIRTTKTGYGRHLALKDLTPYPLSTAVERGVR